MAIDYFWGDIGNGHAMHCGGCGLVRVAIIRRIARPTRGPDVVRCYTYTIIIWAVGWCWLMAVCTCLSVLRKVERKN